MAHIECPYCAIEMEYVGLEYNIYGRNEVYECPRCGTLQRYWLIDLEGGK